MLKDTSSPRDWADELAQGCDAMGLVVEVSRQRTLLAYLELLARWNRTFNLTAIRDPAAMVSRHLLDSLSILPWVDSGPVLDVGTGAGLPGIPLAIARPELTFTLLDANGKKTRFVNQAVAELRLSNVEVIRGRVEAVEPRARYARITARAFATLADLVAGTDRLLLPQGCWLAMKGAAPHAEIRDLPTGLHAEIEPLHVPGEIARRHLVVIRRARRDEAPLPSTGGFRGQR